eukprot:GHVU01176717.1.p2 GENE.GHVU01176717.1~~GHVU01176717.1.p2  ORF type:complete len:100 (+),score=7.63 GHVU01176717.1:306-605(+)
MAKSTEPSLTARWTSSKAGHPTGSTESALNTSSTAQWEYAPASPWKATRVPPVLRPGDARASAAAAIDRPAVFCVPPLLEQSSAGHSYVYIYAGKDGTY